MATATVDGTVLAESDATVVVEGNHYFPPESVNWEFFAEAPLTTACPWKGTANYFKVTVGGNALGDVAWTYREPLEAAAEIKDHVAFYPAVAVSG